MVLAGVSPTQFDLERRKSAHEHFLLFGRRGIDDILGDAERKEDRQETVERLIG